MKCCVLYCFLSAQLVLGMRSNHTNGVPGPLLSGLSEAKKVLARLNFAHVQVNLENDALIFRSRCAARSQNRSACFTQ